MAKSKAASSGGGGGAVGSSLPRLLRWPVQFAHGLLFRHEYFKPLLALTLLAELLLGLAIIQKVAYTEIDWIAYMEEVGGFLGGEWDYAQLKGQTGPLVYPAGFVYLYSALYYLTDFGANILRAQYIFLALYLATVAVLMCIYHQARVCPPWVFLFLCASRRIHSIFLLRCFNDCCAMLLLYVAILLLLRNRWTWACTVVSLALSIKMNILLFMPALGILLLQRFGVWRTVPRLLLMIALQVVLAIPFLMVAPWNYLRLAFDFSRSFFYIWTVNLKVVDEQTFLSPELSRGLLITHVTLIVVFLHKMLDGGLIQFVRDMVLRLLSFGGESAPTKKHHPSGAYIVTLMFIINFVGVACAKSLHYQFYVWYFHTLPVLLYLTPLPNFVRLLVLIVIEYAWNVFPATAASSGLLIASHLALLAGLLFSTRLPAAPVTSRAVTTQRKVQ